MTNKNLPMITRPRRKQNQADRDQGRQKKARRDRAPSRKPQTLVTDSESDSDGDGDWDDSDTSSSSEISDNMFPFARGWLSNDSFPYAEPISTPLSVQIPSKIQKKIWQDKYVDLASLLPTYHSMSQQPQFAIQLSHNSEVSLVPKSKTRKIVNLDLWLTAFHRFVIKFPIPRTPGRVPKKAVTALYEDERIAFGSKQYRIRSYLATCHWNENINRSHTSIRHNQDPRAPRRQVGRKVLTKHTFKFRLNIWQRNVKSVYSNRNWMIITWKLCVIRWHYEGA